MSFLGCPYPLQTDVRGYFHVQSDLNQIRSDLLILLLTNPGERVMMPEFGTGLRDLIFEPNDPTLSLRAREMIIKSISTFEPRITVESIDITNSADEASLNPADTKENNDSILMIKIRFVDPQNIRDVQELKLAIPLGAQ